VDDKLDFAELKAAGILPSPKGVALTVMKLCQRENVSLPELAHTIQADPVLDGRIIKIANVVNHNKARPIASVTTDTLILIGIQAVRQVILGFSLVTTYREGDCKAFDYTRYWSRSVAMASAAQAIGAAVRIAPPAELFTCGLLSGVGRLGLAAVRPDAYSTLLEQMAGPCNNDLVAAETARFGLNHRDLSSSMMADWSIPKLFIDVVFHHENPEASGFAEGSRQRKLTHTVQLAALLADTFLADEHERARQLPRLFQLGNQLDISPEQLVGIANQTLREWADWGQLLHIETGKLPEFMLPEDLANPPRAAEIAPPTPTVTPPPTLRASRPLRILVADDDETLLFTVSKLLSMAGHTVFTARDGRLAYEIAVQERPHVIVADWPVLSLCRTIRANPWGRDILYIVLAPIEDEHRQIEAFEAGADAYLKKPFNPRLLTAKLAIAERRLA